MNLSAYGKYLANLYNDQMDILRQEQITDGAETVSINSNAPFLSGVACRVSFGSQADLQSTADLELKQVNPTVFCGKDVDIKAGDSVIVRRLNSDGSVYQTFEGFVSTAGMANKYETHQQFVLELKADA
jgi:hypothetical protein